MAVQNYIWLTNLLNVSVEPSDIYVHLIGDIPNEYLDFLKQKNVNLIRKENFDVRNKYCNKLVQLESFEALKDYDYVFLMDCDTAVISLEGLELTKGIYAKIVDFPNPPLEILEEIFNREGFKVEEAITSFAFNGENITDWNNCNGGVYIIHRDFLPKLVSRWKDYASKYIENKEVFPSGYAKHSDQVGFALAMASLKEKVIHLGLEWNYPVHIPIGNNKVIPKIIHFHNKIDQNFKLLSVQDLNVDKQIEVINERLSDINNQNRVLINERLENDLIKEKQQIKNRTSHPRNISTEKEICALSEVERPDLLKNLIHVSREHFGFFTSHYPRVYEYTWLLHELENEKGDVLDIGAGVCPLPIYLAQNGMNVTTVDSHPKVRLRENMEQWNEWGFIDYSMFKSSIKSLNIDFMNFKEPVLFDFIYSISVIEHIPKKTRKKLLRKAASKLKKGGKLLISMDVIPNSNKIWNLSEDKEVESVNRHGTIGSFKKELLSSGFELLEDHVQRNIPDSRTDVYYVKASLKKKNILLRFFN